MAIKLITPSNRQYMEMQLRSRTEPKMLRVLTLIVMRRILMSSNKSARAGVISMALGGTATEGLVSILYIAKIKNCSIRDEPISITLAHPKTLSLLEMEYTTTLRMMFVTAILAAFSYKATDPTTA
ncbi:hypothetical protein Mal52_38040 [Symmachiella dynata]|uniref:Uncharacterized protein n=1 Tax=Symmachiella dynata TaxID=2527995 RepID=A0A517ZS38_9PLAN|nr:hypothetical protein Mal52_38040 [Symmachiella dynata]